MDGGSLVPLLSDPGLPAVERAEDALIFYRPSAGVGAVRQGAHKLYVVWNRFSQQIVHRELYRVDAETNPDLGEMHDLSAVDSCRADRLEAILTGYLAKIGALAIVGWCHPDCAKESDSAIPKSCTAHPPDTCRYCPRCANSTVAVGLRALEAARALTVEQPCTVKGTTAGPGLGSTAASTADKCVCGASGPTGQRRGHRHED